MEVKIANGWEIHCTTIFLELYKILVDEVKGLIEKDPDNFDTHPTYHLLHSVDFHLWEYVPSDPSNKLFVLGNTLGKDHRAWKRVKKMMPDRYRLFFQYRSSPPKAIVYAYFNDRREGVIRKDGAKNDIYTVFLKMLESKNVASSWEDLLKKSKRFSEDDTLFGKQ